MQADFFRKHFIKGLVALHVVAWTLIPTLTFRNAPLDVMEGFAWGREWQLGTYKHPPLQSWLLEISGTLFGTSGVGYFGLSALCGGIALWAAYRTALLLADETTAIFSTALTQSILYFTFLSPEFNPNTLQLMFWALAGYAFARALVLESTGAWLALGVIFAAGLYAKYFIGVCALSFGFFLLFEPKYRKWLMRPQPYAAVVLCLLLLAPHAMWLHKFGYLPFTYASNRFEHQRGMFQNFRVTMIFLAAQMGALLPAFGLAALLLRSRTPKTSHSLLIRWLAFAPLVIVLTPSLILERGLHSIWGIPMLTFIPLWLVSRFRIDTGRVRSFAIAWSVVFVLTLAAFAGNELFAAKLGFKPSRGQFPGRAVAEYYFQAWKTNSGSPFIYVVGDEWEAANIAFYSPERPRPHVWIYGTDSVSPWINEDDVLNQGAVVVWNADETKHPAWLDVFMSRFPGTILQEERTFSNGIVLGSAILPPAAKRNLQ
jgi:4-amino-4-deoxy-L-arabinose transferase-like glycosyltransferase